MQEHLNRWGASWFRAGVVITNGAGKYLCVEEKRAKINGVYRDVRDIWNLPSGCAECNEDLRMAAVRETNEETGYDVHLNGICQMIQCFDQYNPYILIVFTAEVMGHRGDFDHNEIGSCRWFSKAEILQFEAEHKLRSPDFILGAIENYECGLIIPLEILKTKK